MIERGTAQGLWDVSCDRCSHTEENLEAEDFRHVVGIIKQSGWMVRPHPMCQSLWEHLCPDCGTKENTAKVQHGGYADGTPV